MSYITRRSNVAVIDQQGQVNTGDLNVSTTPANEVANAPVGGLTLANPINISAGKRKLKVINKGGTVPVGGVLGKNLPAELVIGAMTMEIPVDPDGFDFESTGHDTADNEYGVFPAITINNPDGAAIWYYAV